MRANQYRLADMSPSIRFWLSVTSLLVCIPLHGAPINIGLGLEIASEDNALNTVDTTQSELTTRPSVHLRHDGVGPSYTSDIDYSLIQDRYRNGTFSDSTRGSGQLNLTWVNVPGRLEWTLSHQSERALADESLADTPENEADRDTTSVQGRLTFGFTNGLHVHYSPSVRRLGVDVPSQDTREIDAVTHQIELRRIVSSTLAVQLALDESSVTRQDATDFTTRSLRAGLVFQSPVLQLQISGGPQELNDDSATGRDTTSFNIDASILLAIGQFNFRSTRQLTDATSGIAGDQSASAPPIGTDQTSEFGDELQEIRRRELAWTIPLSTRVSFTTTASRERRVSIANDASQIYNNTASLVRYQFNPTMDVQLTYSSIEGNEQPSFLIDRNLGTIVLTKLFNQRLSMNLTWQRNRQRLNDQIAQSDSTLLGLQYCLTACAN
ncbi:MAG: hypothetical protein AAF525_14475 [Pseudomonadota bacterium]